MDLKQLLGSLRVDKFNELTKAAYERGFFAKINTAIWEALQPGYRLTAEQQDDAMRTHNAAQQLTQHSSTLWGMINAVVYSVVVICRISPDVLVAAVQRAAESAEAYRKSHEDRMAAGVFDAELEVKEIGNAIFSHLGGSAEPGQQAATPATFAVPGDGRVH